MTDEESLLKDVFAWYGSAAYTAQCFEAELCILLLAHERLTDPEVPSKDLDKLDDVLSRKTLGQLLGEVKKRFQVHPEFEAILSSYLKSRNYVVHRFFFENSAKMMTMDGCKELIAELKELTRLFREADLVAQKMSSNIRVASGIDESSFQELVRSESGSNSD